MTWDAYHRRTTALRSMLALADRSADPRLEELLATVPGARSAYPDPALVLLDAQMAFVQRVRGQIDLLLGDDVESVQDRAALVAQAWAGVADAMPGARALLDLAEENGALAPTFDRERAIVAELAGISPRDPDLLARGERIRQRARRKVTRRAGDDDDPGRQGLLGRLREVFAA